jgi:hemoglobin
VNRVTEKENQIPWLCEWLGGAEVQNALMVKFYERVSADELLRPLFGDMPADHPRHVADFVGEALGGSQAYTVRRGGHATMLAHHFGKNISEAQRRRWVNFWTARMRSGFPAIRNSGRRWWRISSGDRGWR